MPEPAQHQAAPVSAFDAESRRFYSTVLLWAAPAAIVFGWLFAFSGTGAVLIAAGLVMEAAALALARSWKRFAAATAGILVGCWPFWLLLAWALTR